MILGSALWPCCVTLRPKMCRTGCYIRVTDAEKKASLTEFGPCAWWCFLVHIHLIIDLIG